MSIVSKDVLVDSHFRRGFGGDIIRVDSRLSTEKADEEIRKSDGGLWKHFHGV